MARPAKGGGMGSKAGTGGPTVRCGSRLTANAGMSTTGSVTVAQAERDFATSSPMSSAARGSHEDDPTTAGG